MSSQTMTIAFLGASSGVGLAALKHIQAAGHQCIALCRYPEKLTAIFPPESSPNLQIVQGNAKDVTAVARCLKTKDGKLVDGIISTVGGKPILTKLTIDDPEVCRLAMFTLMEALATLRKEGVTGKPYIAVCSTTGISHFGRDVPCLLVPLYHVGLKVPHEDKKIMEDTLIESGEDFTIVRASLLTSGDSETPIRVGIEDPKAGRESEAIGYTISREDTGKWIAERLFLQREEKYRNKIAMVTY
ncbi:hypothetical protein BP6252_06627 [Coleophoma cylindrospora]|uniref:NAD(P)-binding domain-containing protein n=1 Tax=Coleophoma cylindrospora TaxID=1849047 RepID=A0A3D8RN59_9HELO|nr:hypothetical protein BP6252_06627 [Coleophoma cylindrospora]